MKLLGLHITRTSEIADLRQELEDVSVQVVEALVEVRDMSAAYAITAGYGQEMRSLLNEAIPVIAIYDTKVAETLAARLLGAQTMYLTLHPDGEPDPDDARQQYAHLTTPAQINPPEGFTL